MFSAMGVIAFLESAITRRSISSQPIAAITKEITITDRTDEIWDETSMNTTVVSSSVFLVW